jgi:hypothetical protein
VAEECFFERKNILKPKGVYKVQPNAENKEGKQRETKRSKKAANYREFNQFSIGRRELCLTLWRRSLKSEMNLCRQSSTDGSMLLNIQSFLDFQMDMRMMISMKKGTLIYLLTRLIIWRIDLVMVTVMPSEAQHAFAKLHLRKR